MRLGGQSCGQLSFGSQANLNSPHHSASRDGTGDEFDRKILETAQSKLLTTSKLE